MVKTEVESPRISWLLAFVSVERFGGYSEAATYLQLTQSTVSRQVASLEKWLGSKLFTRNKPPRLTAFGKTLLPSAKKIIGIMYGSQRDGASYPLPAELTPRQADAHRAMWLLSVTV